MMKRLVQLICLMLCMLMLPVYPVSAEGEAPSVRVLLRRLELTDRADLILDGVYTAKVGGKVMMSFPQKAEVTVAIRGGELYLFYEGMVQHLGGEVTFIRNASGGDDARTGIRFEKNGGLYPGDLRLTISGGALYPVCTMSVEDYLLGVVPYEMSEYFPLEALKAQAVCARTYALSHVDKSKDYDVVDTTNDQVFKGVNLNDATAIRAVKETAGMVGMYKGKLASCYYSASNGGQTELVENVWSGRGDWSYYTMVDDPFDLENPESVVRKARLNKDGSNVPADFTVVVASYMADEMIKHGFEPIPRAFRMDSITKVELGGSKFDAPSRMVDEMTITFTWSGRKLLKWHQESPVDDDEEISLFAVTPVPTATPTPSPTPEITPEPEPVYSEFIAVEEPFTLTLPLFPEVIRALKISISGSDNEMVTLKETNEAFTLEARRYGHGVGMSQRGAQWMAGQHGKTYEEILSFYYPGMTLSKVDAGAAVLPTTQPELAETPGPPATPTPRPTLMPVTGALPQGAYLASVENIEDDSSLNLRAEPSTASEILMRLYKHQQLAVLEVCDDPAWVKVKTDVIEGYVMLSFLEKVE